MHNLLVPATLHVDQHLQLTIVLAGLVPCVVGSRCLRDVLLPLVGEIDLQLRNLDCHIIVQVYELIGSIPLRDVTEYHVDVASLLTSIAAEISSIDCVIGVLQLEVHQSHASHIQIP